MTSNSGQVVHLCHMPLSYSSKIWYHNKVAMLYSSEGDHRSSITSAVHLTELYSHYTPTCSTGRDEHSRELWHPFIVNTLPKFPMFPLPIQSLLPSGSLCDGIGNLCPVLAPAQVLVLDLSSATSLRFCLGTLFWTGLGPCVASALFFVFISHKTRFTSVTKKIKKLMLLLALVEYLVSSNGRCMYVTFSVSKS